jgi:hypothetical protein
MLAKVIVLTVRFSSLVFESNSQSTYTEPKHEIAILSAQNLL